jgi:hypothetical protein
MYTNAKLQEYMDEIRERVCSRCIERPPGGPPCLPLGKQCGIETHLAEYIEAIHAANSAVIDPYIENTHCMVCNHCARKGCDGCPCPMDYLVGLVVQAVETVDERPLETVCETQSSSK